MRGRNLIDANMPSRPAARPILYVEDEENDVFLVKYGLQKASIDHPLKVLTNGQEAVDYLSGAGDFSNREEHPLPCLVLLDINLPLLSGMQVLRWVREQKAFRDLPIIMFSSSEQPRDKEQARELGATDYLLKPANPSHFVDLAHRLKARWLPGCDAE